MRLSGVPVGLALACVSLPAAPLVHGQISYVSRDSFIAYFEQDFDPNAVPPFQESVTFRVDDAAGTTSGDTFDRVLVYPGNGTPYDDTTADQFSRLFADAIEFHGRAIAEEDRTDNLFGIYTAGATSQFNVVFDIAEAIDFTITGTFFDASASNRPGTTEFSLTGPSVNLAATSGPLDFSGTMDPGRYTLDVFIESLGEFRETVFEDIRTRGEDLGFDFLLLLAGGGVLGDYNANGLVEQGDLNQVLNNWGSPFDQVAAAWINQRPTDGIVDQAELNVVLNNWGSNTTPDFSGSSVPEPTAAVLLLGLTASSLRRGSRSCWDA